ELAKGFGVNEYNEMLGSTKANSARVKTPKEFAMKNINDNTVFGQSLLRNVLASIYISLKEEDTNKGLNWLKTEVNDYWNSRNMLVEMLNYLSKIEIMDGMKHWKECAHEAYILKNLVENDSI
ncbi:MAG: DNA methylase, partial [Clostridium perfringens]|nr:DNA methylase [Clostridium perfringens]